MAEILTTSRFTSIVATGDDWRGVAQSAVEQLRGAPPATLGFLYLTDLLADDASSLLALLRGATGVTHWVGAVGVGIAGNDTELFDRPAAAIMLADIPAGSFQIFPTMADDTRPASEALGPWQMRHEPLLGLVHGDPRNPKTPLLIEALGQATGSYLVGGLTSSRGAHAQIAEQVTEGGVSGVLFDQSLAVATALTQGCSPVGPVHTITSAEQNILLELDNRPALDVFKEDMNSLMHGRSGAQPKGDVHAAFPIQGSDTGDYLVRNLMGIDPKNGAIAVAELARVGDPVLFVWRDRTVVMTELEKTLAQLRQRIARDYPGRPVRGALYTSCVARGPSTFGQEGVELRAVQQQLGNVPLVGFFAQGEICNTRLYGYTGVLTLFL